MGSPTTADDCRRLAAWYARIAEDLGVALRERRHWARGTLTAIKHRRRAMVDRAHAWQLRAEALEGEEDGHR